MYSFSENKKQLDVQAFLRRAIDTSTPNRPPVEGESRWDPRANRTFPLILAPWVDGEARPDEAVTALTKNLSGQGMTAIIAVPLEAEELVIGFALEARLVAGPAHGKLKLNKDGSFTYTPTAGFSGADSFRYRVFDGHLDSATVAIVTIEVSDAGKATPE